MRLRCAGDDEVSMLVSHLSFRPKVAGSADATALNSRIAVPPTHTFNIDLRHLQDQTKLLAEQQLCDCTCRDATVFKYKLTNLSDLLREENRLTDLQHHQMSTQRQSHDFLQTPSPTGSK